MSTKQSQQQTALVHAAAGGMTRFGFDGEQVDLIKRTIAKGTTDDELALFLAVAQRSGLDPFLRQIYAVRRWDSDLGREVMAIQIGIDGYRISSHRTGDDAGMDPAQWCGADGSWVDVWLHDEPPAASRVTVYRKGVQRGFTAVALWAAYVQTKKDGRPNKMWARSGPHMLAKCAEALARRMAYPIQLPDDSMSDGQIIEAEFTEISDTVSETSTHPAASKPAAQPAPPPPRAPAGKPAPVVLSDDALAELIEAIGKADGVDSIKELDKRIFALGLGQDSPQRARLLEERSKQIALIAEAAKADAGGAP